MLRGIAYLLCVYLAFKGLEIWMVGATAPTDHGSLAAWVGAVLAIVAIVLAILFFVGFSMATSLPG